MSMLPKETTRWLDYEVRVHTLPPTLDEETAACYRFLIASKLAWRVDHIDEHEQIWLALHHVDDVSGEDWYETLRLEAGSFRLVPCEPSYPAIVNS